MDKISKPNFDIELRLSDQYQLIAGIDEVGRGAIAGPIVAGTVIFSDYRKTAKKLNGVNDSKKLTHKQRAELVQVIKDTALDYAIGQVSPQKIDLIGIGAANILAFERALQGLKQFDYAVIDGRKFRGFKYPFSCYVKGESLSLSIAAASIIAKEYRDELMRQKAKEFVFYDFESNVGYGGKTHYDAIEKHGPCQFHRQTFLNKFYDSKKQLGLF